MDFSTTRKYFKTQLGKIDTGYTYSATNKTFWYNFYLDFFIGLQTNYYDYDNWPKSIDKMFMEKVLCSSGYGAFFMHPKFDLVFSRGTMGNRLDIYDNPKIFKPVNNALDIVKFREIEINWYLDDLNPEWAIVIGNDNFYRPAFDWLSGFCSKLADIEQTIQLNRNAQNAPIAVIADQNSHFSLKNLINKVLNGDPVIYINKQKDAAGNLSAIQLEDYVHVLDMKQDYLLDKLHDEKQRVINQMLTNIGINNNAIDKAERLTAAEATSNNGLINACIQRNWEARKQGIERVNRCWGLNIDVHPSDQITKFNTEMVYTELESNINEIVDNGDDNGETDD